MFDLLVSADLLVDDADASVAALVERVGFAPPKPHWVQRFPGSDNIAAFMRINADIAIAPTLLEVISPAAIDAGDDEPVPPSYIGEIHRQQHPRPVRTHSTVLASPDIDGLVDRLRSLGIRHRVDPPVRYLPFPRVWLGVTPDDPTGYDERTDGGLRLEVIPTSGLRLPSDAAGPRTYPEPLGVTPLRIAARGHLVKDLDQTLRTLEHTVGWSADGIVTAADVGHRRATMALGYARSAEFHIVAPTAPDSDEGRHLDSWGPGPFYTRIEVGDLDAVAEDLDARRTQFVRLDGDDDVRVPRLRVTDPRVAGVLLEFSEPTW